jgi:Kef-type K+ transport system membrane component KefB
MGVFLPFFLVLFAAVFLTVFSRRLHIPWTVGLILGGALIGPFGFDLVKIDGTLSLMGEIGLLFLLFMAGLETRLSSFNAYKKHIALYSFMYMLIPAFFALLIALFFDMSLIGSLLLIIVFISSSVSVALPTLEGEGLMHTRIGKIIIDSIVVVDIISLIALSVLITHQNGGSLSPLPYIVALLSAFLLKYFMPSMVKFFMEGKEKKMLYTKKKTEQELQIAVVLLVGMSLLFDLLGLHYIIGGFIAGLLLSETVTVKHLLSKIHALGYGLFIPVFFVLIGIQSDLSVFFGEGMISVLFFTSIIVFFAIISKILAGLAAGFFDKECRKESFLAGVAGIPRLSTTLIAIYALSLGEEGNESLVAALIAMTIITTIIGPLLLTRASTLLHRNQKKIDQFI